MEITEKEMSWVKFLILKKILDFLKYNKNKMLCKSSLAHSIDILPSNPYFNKVFKWIEKNSEVEIIEIVGQTKFVKINYEILRQASHELDIPTIMNEYAKKHCDRSMWRGE